MDHPPINALTQRVRQALLHALDEAQDQRVRAVVLASAGRNFSAGSRVDAGIPARQPDDTPSLLDLCRAIEDLHVPVVAALQGATVGPGAELAVAAHARIADSTTRIVFPEVGLGLVTEAGTTQRLPRLVGAAEALEMLLRARPTRAEEGLAIGLIDVLTETDVLEAAVAHAARMPGPRPVRDRTDGLLDVAGFQAAVTAARAGAARGGLPAPGRIIDCVEAALMLPFENGLALEAVAREDLEAGDESQALCAVALAERRAAVLPPAVARIRAKTVVELGFVGAGPQMAGLALVALGQGMTLRWADPDPSRRAASIAWISQRQEAEVQAGRMSPLQRDADRARLSDMEDPRGLQGCDLVVHGAAGDVLTGLGRMLPEAPQLVMGGAEGAFGLTLASSARMAELALPTGAAPAHVAVAVQFLRRIGLPPVIEHKMPIVGRRVAMAGRGALVRLLEMGVPKRLLASALDGFGQSLPQLPEPAAVAAMPSIQADGVLNRWQAAMVNEGLRMLDAGVAVRPSDIDLVMVTGFGFPRWQGGPMHHAARRGLLVLRRDLRLWAKDDAALWSPHPLLDRLISDGQTLADLDRQNGPA